ncbi:hypothetical protein LCGC14_0906970 [marine sediment metagenome]|uniref:Uncharacterized protein n=1 Tax=marine sediment metagenome TaxID=412755 RepID=A0A0F9PFI2_9ZZZZ
MAIARIGNVVGAISGNLGGVVFANTHQGLLVKHRPLKTNQRTTDQLAERSRMQRIITVWKTLTTAEYLEWRVLADKVNQTNRLGVTSSSSPLSIFIRMNRVEAYLGIPLIRTPYRLGAAEACFVESIVFTEGSFYDVALSFSDPFAHRNVWVYGYRPMRTSPTRGVRSWKFLGRAFFEGFSPRSINTIWEPKLGPLSAGEFVHVKFSVQTVGGIRNPPTTVTTTVLAP